MRPMMTVVALCVLLAGGCATPQMKQDPMVQRTDSKVLGTAFSETLAELVGLMEQETGKLPPEATKRNLVARSMEMKDGFPSLFMVSAGEEADFEAGRFHDDDNKTRMKQSLQKLENYEAALPQMSCFLTNKLSKGKLEGAQLELATRLLSSHVDQARAEAERTDTDAALIPEGKFRLEVGEDLAWSDDTLLIPMTVRINPTAQELGTRIQFRYTDKVSSNSWDGTLNKKQEQKLLFAGQFKSRSPARDVPVLMYTFQHGGASTSDVQEAPGKDDLDEVLRFTAKTGFYDLGKPLVIGELAGNPITLSVEPPKK